MLKAIKKYLQKKTGFIEEKSPVEAYDIWSSSYDVQPGNLMLDLDEIVFCDLIKKVELQDKLIIDIGCGTGRHWQKLYAKQPSALIGYDVSEGMLQQLKTKFFSAITYHATDNFLTEVDTASVDCIVSTLTIAHIQNMPEAIESWIRVLKNGGDLIITDFHPDLLAQGGRRTFKQGNKQVAVVNYAHPVEAIIKTASEHGCKLIDRIEKVIDDSVRSYYMDQNAMHVFNRFKGMSVIYGVHLKKIYGTE